MRHYSESFFPELRVCTISSGCSKYSFHNYFHTLLSLFKVEGPKLTILETNHDGKGRSLGCAALHTGERAFPQHSLPTTTYTYSAGDTTKETQKQTKEKIISK